MAVTIAAQDVIDDVVFRLHLPTPAAGEFITEAQALSLLQSAARRLSGFLSRCYGDAYWSADVTLSTQADINILSLPSDFVSLRSVHWVNGNDAYELERADVQEHLSESSSWTDCRLPRYRLEGTSVLVLSPTPNAVYSVRIAYQNNGIEIEDADTTFQGLPGWQEWLVLDMCQRIREREQKPADEFIRDRMELEGHIKEQASQRDRFAAVQVRDATGALCRDRRWPGSRARWRY